MLERQESGRSIVDTELPGMWEASDLEGGETDAAELRRPTIRGKADGIVGWEPCVLQCRVCGVTTTQDRSSVAAFIILSRFHFHICEEREGIRMCPDCLKAAVAACPSGRCKHA